ncbi:MAG: hypothetical protein KKD44_26230 [Proteobacteria bacterium]|nr:hypothetical protein [Pseudomonadota bacterium]
MTGEIIYLIGFAILGFTAYIAYKHYIAAEVTERPRLVRIYIIVFIASFFLFTGIKMLHIPEKLGIAPKQVTEAEAQDAFQHYLKDH